MPKPRPSEDRKKVVRVRLSAEELARLEEAAANGGLTLSGHVRRVMLSAPAGYRARRPPVEVVELARLLAQIGKIGSNLNQLAHLGNTGAAVDGVALAAELGELAVVRDALLAALGRQPVTALVAREAKRDPPTAPPAPVVAPIGAKVAASVAWEAKPDSPTVTS